MNGTTLTVVVTVVSLILSAIVAILRSSKDSRDYLRHYDENGFRPAACDSPQVHLRNADGIMVGESRDRDT